MKTFQAFIEDCSYIEESSSGERGGRRTRGTLTMARGRGSDMSNRERTIAAISKKAGIKGTGKYSTKDLRGKSSDYIDAPTNKDKRGAEIDTHVGTEPSLRKYANLGGSGVVDKGKDWSMASDSKKTLPSSHSVRKLKDLVVNLKKTGANIQGRVHSVNIGSRHDYKKDSPNKLGERQSNFRSALRNVPKNLKKAGAKSGDPVVFKPESTMTGETDNPQIQKRGENSRARIYKRVAKKAGVRVSDKSHKTGHMTSSAKDSIDEFYDLVNNTLEEGSSGERGGRRTRGRLTMARGRGSDMSNRERTVASISKRAGLRGTGKYSTKDLRTTPKDYTTYDSEDDLEDIGSTKQDHSIRSYSSLRKASNSEQFIRKLIPSGKRHSTGKPVLKTSPSSESVRKVKELRKQAIKSGGNKRGKVHNVDIMSRDPNIVKDDPENRMERGKNFMRAVKDTPNQLKKAGAKRRDIVIARPSSVLPGESRTSESKKRGKDKRAKLYKKVFGNRATKMSPKTKVMVGASD